jgi:hypothetical protein
MSLNITPPKVKFELHAYGEVHDVSNSLLDWKQNEVILSRKDTSGVYREFTFPFKFVLESYKIVESIFEARHFRAKADVYVYPRNNDWTYTGYYVFNLDFSTYKKSDTVIEINARLSDLYEYLKSKETVNYDMPVSEVKEPAPLEYERIEFDNKIEFLTDSPTISWSLSTGNKLWKYQGVSYLNEDKLDLGIISYPTVGYRDKNSDSDYFIEALTDCDIEIDAHLWAALALKKGNFSGNAKPANLRVSIYISRKSDISSIEMEDHNYIPDTPPPVFYPMYTSASINYKKKIHLSKGERLYAGFLVENASPYGGGSSTMEFDVSAGGSFSISYKAKFPSINIDIINPNILLQKLVDKITETEGYIGKPLYLARIEDFNENSQDLTLLLAAESIRGFDGAKVHASHKDFKAWMMTLGYEMFVDGNELTYRKREKSFNKNIQAIELFEEDCADLKTEVEKDYLFSGLKIGYKKKDYENTNGRFEFNGQHDYSSDCTVNSKILELISPYRADCYGIEFLAQTRGKDTTDDKSDKDVFIVNVKKNGDENYKIAYPVELSGNAPNSTLFNTKFNPFALLKLNANLLGASVNTLRFTASDANKDIIIGKAIIINGKEIIVGERIDGDYTIPEEVKLFEAVSYDFASRNIKELPAGDSINGLVKIHYKGKVYEGFIKEISKSYTWESETQWVLYKKYIKLPDILPDIHNFTFTFDDGKKIKDRTHSRIGTWSHVYYESLRDGEPFDSLTIQQDSSQSWCDVSIQKEESRIQINTSQNYSIETRYATIKLVQNVSNNEITVNITQTG